VLESGLPNVLDKVTSLSIRTTLLAGPQTKDPEKAPAVVKTEGTTVVKSTSDTLTPGDS
jgi:hypothetical protein